MRYHKIHATVTEEEEVVRLRGIADTLINEMISGIDAIEGLNFWKGLKCRRCVFCGSKSGLASHTSLHHNGETPEGDECFLQRATRKAKNIVVSDPFLPFGQSVLVLH